MRLITVVGGAVLSTLLFLGAISSFAQEPAPQEWFSSEGASTQGSGDLQPLPGGITQRGYVPVADTVTIMEYALPVSPINLLSSKAGDIWFSSFTNNAIGKVQTDTGQVLVYARQGDGNVWGIKQDSEGYLWYTVANSAVVGRLDPSTSTFREWSIARMHFGLDIDQATGDVWFTASDPLGAPESPGLYRLSPATNLVTHWAASTFFHLYLYDLCLSPDGNVWFTMNGGQSPGIGNLDPTTDQVTFWTVPITNSRPFRLIVPTANEVWFSEIATVTNSIAQLIPSTNMLKEFRLPTPDSYPRSVLKKGDAVWFTARGANSIGRLDPILASPTMSVLNPITLTATRAASYVSPISRTVVAQVTPGTIISTSVAPTSTGGFTQFTLPVPNSGPFGIVLEPDQRYLWFAEDTANRIGKMEVVEAAIHKIFLPIVLRGY